MSWAKLPVHRRAKTFHAVSKYDVSGLLVVKFPATFCYFCKKLKKTITTKILLTIEQFLSKDFFG